jgi:WD40 repeat protein
MTVETLPSPFKGLASFQDTELDALLFFGREREREIVLANLMASRLTVLYGASGVGKTSLLRAAVATSLREVPDSAVVVFSSWAGDPARGLREAIEEAAGIEATGSLVEVLEAVGGDVYVILDQFEEYFLYERNGAGPGFASELAAAIREPGLRANFLLGLREDALAKLDAFKTRIPNLFGNYLRLDHLDRRGGREAIVRPLERYGELGGETVSAEPELVETVLDQVETGRVDQGMGRGGVTDAGEGRIETPYLQLVMQRLWEEERAEGSTTLRLSTLERLGGAERIVAEHLERALGTLTSDERDEAARVFNHLVTPSGTKIAHGLDDLAKYAAAPQEEVREVVEGLTRARVLRPVAAPDDPRGVRFEIFHDVLAPAVLAWRLRHDSERALVQEREEGRLRQRRFLLVLGITLVLLAAMTAVAVYALTQRSEARRAARVASARELTASAFAQLPTDPQLSLLLAREAAARERSPAVEDVLRSALLASRVRRVVRMPARSVVRGAIKPRAPVFSRDGSRFLLIRDDGVEAYATATGRRLYRLGASGLESAVFGPKGRVILTGGADGRLSVWRVRDGSFVTSMGGGAAIRDVSAQGAYAATGAADGSVAVWRVSTRIQIVAFAAGGPVDHVELSPRGRLLLTVAGRRIVRVFDLIDRRQVAQLSPTGLVASASFRPDGHLVVTAGADRVARIWNPTTGALVHAFPPVGGQLTDAAFSPGSKLLATASVDGIARVYDLKSKEPLATLAGHTNYVQSVAFSPNGKLVVTGSRDRTARIWQADGGLPGIVLAGHAGPVVAASFSPDGRSVVTVGEDGTARIWDAGTEPSLRLLGAQAGPLLDAELSADGRRVVSTGERGTAGVWELPTRRQLALLRQPPSLASARLDRHGGVALTAGADGTARLWRVSDGTLLHVLRSGGPVTSASFSPDDSLVVTTSADRTARLWRASDGRELHVLREPAPVTTAAFSPDGKLVATAAGQTASLWDVASGRRLHRLRGHTGPIVTVAFDTAGRYVVTASEDATARLWRVSDGAAVAMLRGHHDALTDAQFSRDGRYVVTSSRDHDARLWAAPSGRLLAVLSGHFGLVSTASFSPDGRWIVTAGPISVGLWNVRNRSALFFLHGNTDLVTSASFSPEGRTILTSSADGTVRTYRCDLCGGLDELLSLARRQLAATHRTLTPVERARYLHT